MSVIQYHEGPYVEIKMSPEAAIVLDRFARHHAARTPFTSSAATVLYEALRAVNAMAADIVSERQGSSEGMSGHERARGGAALPPSASPATDEPAWITVTEAAQRSGWSERHVRRQARCGHLRAERTPMGWRIDPMDAAVRGFRPA